MASPRAPRQRLSTPIVWAGLAVCLSAVFVQTTRSGLDILVLLVAAFVLLVLERTVGDWIADTLGSGAAALIFTGIALGGLLYVSSGSGRASAARFFAGAQARGYRAAYLSFNTPGKAAELPPLQVAPPSSGARERTDPPADRTVVPSVAAASSPPSAAASSRSASGVRITRVRSSAEVATVAQPITLYADVAADDDGQLPPIEFSIDGRVVATVTPKDGRATATWSTRVPGQYVVRARVPGTFTGGTRLSTVITVLPGRVPASRSRHDSK